MLILFRCARFGLDIIKSFKCFVVFTVFDLAAERLELVEEVVKQGLSMREVAAGHNLGVQVVLLAFVKGVEVVQLGHQTRHPLSILHSKAVTRIGRFERLVLQGLGSLRRAHPD